MIFAKSNHEYRNSSSANISQTKSKKDEQQLRVSEFIDEDKQFVEDNMDK